MSDHQGTPPQHAPTGRARREEPPFPVRDPRDEARGLIVTELDCLAKINHFCFAGRQRFGGGFRVLVAGDGTGDRTIFLAEQLRDHDASVTYLDVGRAGMEIARERARVRDLENVTWHHGSVLDSGALVGEPFDLVCCTDAPHHPGGPGQGIGALRGVLAPGGAMSLMLHGRFGRLGIHAGRDLVGLVNDGVDGASTRTRNARGILEAIPQSNWLLRGGDRRDVLGRLLGDEGNLHDTFLREPVRAYSVTEIYDLLAGAGLEPVEFVSATGDVPSFRYLYDPMVWISDPRVREHVAALPLAKRQAIAEAIGCVITRHGLYAASAAAGRIARPDGPDMVPFFLYFDRSALVQGLREAQGRPFALTYRHSTVRFTPGRFSAEIVAEMDGRRSLGEIFDTVRAGAGQALPGDQLLRDFMAFYEPLNGLDIVLLRHRDVTPFPEFPLERAA